MLTQMSSKEASGNISVVQRININLSNNFIRSSQLGLYSLSYTFIHFQNLAQKYFRSFLLTSLATCCSFILYYLFPSILSLFPSWFLCLHFVSIFYSFLGFFFSCYFSFFFHIYLLQWLFFFSVSLIFSFFCFFNPNLSFLNFPYLFLHLINSMVFLSVSPHERVSFFSLRCFHTSFLQTVVVYEPTDLKRKALSSFRKSCRGLSNSEVLRKQRFPYQSKHPHGN